MMPASIDERENFVTVEVGRHALNKSVLTVNGSYSS